MLRPVALAALALLAVVALAGCTSAPRSTTVTVTGVLSGQDDGPHTPVGIPEGDVGRAPVSAVGGGLIGTVVFRKTLGGFELELPQADFGGDPTTVIWALADSPFSTTTCGSDNVWEIGFPGGQPTPPLIENGMFADDPSFFDEVVVVRQLDRPDAAGCSQPIIATGPITWSIPLQRPWIHPVDRGSKAGATGSVSRANGLTTTYTTAAGDSWGAIAARFGVTSSDLAWLNPNRLGNDAPDTAYAQQVLNLDPAGRGDSESRRPH